MNERTIEISGDGKRLREAARWYVRHESETELSPVEWQDWDTWSADPERSAEYDEFVRLHQQARTLVRPELPHDDEIRADVPRTSVLRRLPFWRGTSRYSVFQSLRFKAAAAAIAGVMLIALATTLHAPDSFLKKPLTATAAPFSEAALKSLRASGRPVLVNLRADWCGTCAVNERIALSRESVRRMMERKHVAYLKGEWTHQDAAVLDSLQRFGRQGVPLYLLYCPGASEPAVLPQILTEDIVLSALSRLPDVG